MKFTVFITLSFISTSILFAQTEETAKVKELKSQLATLNSEKKQLQSKLDESVKELEEKNAKLQNDLTELQEDLNNKSNLIKEKEDLIEQKEVIITSMQGIINNNALTQEQQKSQIALKNKEISSLEDQIDEKQKLITSKEQNIESVKTSISTLKETIDSKEEVIKTKQETIEDKNEIIEDKETKIAKLNDNFIILQTQNLNKRKWLRVVQGVGFYKFRTPDYSLQPKSSSEPNTLVISNSQTGDWEGDYFVGFSVMAYDFNKTDSEQRISIGPFIAFGGKDLFRNFYLGADFKLYMIHINAGWNFHEFQVLKSGFNENDELDAGQTIPTTNEWKTFIPYFGVSIDTEFLLDIMDKTKKK